MEAKKVFRFFNIVSSLSGLSVFIESRIFKIFNIVRAICLVITCIFGLILFYIEIKQDAANLWFWVLSKSMLNMGLIMYVVNFHMIKID